MYNITPSYDTVAIKWNGINTPKMKLKVKRNGLTKWSQTISNPPSSGGATGKKLKCGKKYRFKAKEKKRHSFKPFPNSKWKWLSNIEIVWYAWSTVHNQTFNTLIPSPVPSNHPPSPSCPGNCIENCFHKDILVKGFDYKEVTSSEDYTSYGAISMQASPQGDIFDTNGLDPDFQDKFYSNLSVKYGTDEHLSKFWRITPASKYLDERLNDSLFFVNGLGTDIDKLKNQRQYVEDFFGIKTQAIWNRNEKIDKQVSEVASWYAWLNHSDAELSAGIPLGDGTKESVFEIIDVIGLILARMTLKKKTQLIGTSQGNLIIATAIRLLYLMEFDSLDKRTKVRNYLKTQVEFLSVGSVIPASNLPFLNNSLAMFENHGSFHDAFPVFASDQNNSTLPWIFTLANKTLWKKNKSKKRKTIALWIYGIVGTLLFTLIAGAYAVYTFTSSILNLIGAPSYYNVYALAGNPLAIPFVIAFMAHVVYLIIRSFNAHSLNKQYITDGTRHVTKNVF